MMEAVRMYEHMMTSVPEERKAEIKSIVQHFGNDPKEGYFCPTFHLLLKKATSEGLCELCDIIREYGKSVLVEKDFEDMLKKAAYLGSRELCIRAKTWGARDFDEMLCSATRGEHREICELAYEWGARNFREMLSYAAWISHRELCELAYKWGGPTCGDFNAVLHRAAFNGNRELCVLAREWGACDFDGMLRYAAQGNRRKLCKLAREWGARNFDGMLSSAAYGGCLRICKLAHKWGADCNSYEMRVCDIDDKILGRLSKLMDRWNGVCGDTSDRMAGLSSDDDSD